MNLVTISPKTKDLFSFPPEKHLKSFSPQQTLTWNHTKQGVLKEKYFLATPVRVKEGNKGDVELIGNSAEFTPFSTQHLCTTLLPIFNF